MNHPATGQSEAKRRNEANERGNERLISIDIQASSFRFNFSIAYFLFFVKTFAGIDKKSPRSKMSAIFMFSNNVSKDRGTTL